MPAPAPRDGFGFGQLDLLRAQAGPLVGAITKGLALGLPTGAPPISARLGLLHKRKLLEYNWFAHS